MLKIYLTFERLSESVIQFNFGNTHVLPSPDGATEG